MNVLGMYFAAYLLITAMYQNDLFCFDSDHLTVFFSYIAIFWILYQLIVTCPLTTVLAYGPYQNSKVW